MLKTEQRNADTMNLDHLELEKILMLINRENYNAVSAVEAALPQIEDAVNKIVEAFENGGRLFYIGAGTSGRLGVMDAAECPPTFGVSRDLVIALIAGGEKAMVNAVEDLEDDMAAGAADLLRYHPGKNDVVVGISASGGAAYVIGALQKARECGCSTIGISNNPGSDIEKIASISIFLDTGAEILTGSTRMKAGTAQKLVLNMLSTCSMIKTGKVYQNMMVNLKPSNKKLRNRMVSIVSELTGFGVALAEKKLDEHEWNISSVMEEYENTKEAL